MQLHHLFLPETTKRVNIATQLTRSHTTMLRKQLKFQFKCQYINNHYSYNYNTSNSYFFTTDTYNICNVDDLKVCHFVICECSTFLPNIFT